MLIWGGIYTSDSSCSMPFDPSSDARAVKTPLIQDSVRRLAIELGFEATQTPFHLSFLLKLKSSDAEIRNRGKANFWVPVGFDPGYPAPLGVSFSTGGSMNLASSSFSGNAAGCVLCLYGDSTSPEPALELDLDPFVKRSGDICLASPESAWTFMSYGCRCKGAALQGDGAKFDAERVLLDPYATIFINSVTDNITRLLLNYLELLCNALE
ncbi:hypothetical protein NC652_033467 [Populus alba x Populus x berolinensis]|nr:hypothetical protein NC652_033467 [Populus alba x Populus x berolinensis]